MIEVNLIPDVKLELLKARRARAFVVSASIITSIAAIGVVILLVVYVYGVQFARQAYLKGQIEKKDAELAQVDNLSEVLTIQNQLSSISNLNSQKLIASRIFDIVSAVSPKGGNQVSFSNIVVSPAGSSDSSSSSGSGAGQIRLEGQAGAFENAEAFKKLVANTSFTYKEDGKEVEVPLASNISMPETSFGEDAAGNRVVRFTMTFDYPAELFSSDTADQELQFKMVVDGKNVTDSYLGIPRFETRASDAEEGDE